MMKIEYIVWFDSFNLNYVVKLSFLCSLLIPYFYTLMQIDACESQRGDPCENLNVV
jgi:hypothetical protein